jgi:hypothetical protein
MHRLHANVEKKAMSTRFLMENSMLFEAFARRMGKCDEVEVTKLNASRYE